MHYAVIRTVAISGTLHVDWFTGILGLPYGDLVAYVHMGYGSTYSDYILLELDEGKLVGSHAFGHEQFSEFLGTKEKKAEPTSK